MKHAPRDLCSQTRLRRAIVAAFPRRRPSRRAARRLLRPARRLAGFADWLSYRAELVMIELEDASDG